MSARRTVIRVDEVVVDAPEGADPALLAAEVRAGLARALAAGVPAGLARDAAVLHTDWKPARRGVWEGVGEALALAAIPASRRTP